MKKTTDLDKAREILVSNSFTLVLCKGDTVYSSELRGVAPIIDFIDRKTDLSGFSAADKIVGKAAAMMFSLSQIKALHTIVISKAALEFLSTTNIELSYDTVVENIINRTGDGFCPMEQLVRNIDNVNEALEAIRNKINDFRKEKRIMKKLGFGCMRLPVLDANDQKSFDKKQICDMVDTFIEKGFTYFDTAYMYHDGASESIVKEVLVDRYPRDKFLLATKLPTMFLKEVEDMERIFSEQITKCGVEFFDYYLLHCLNKENYDTCNRLGAFEFASKLKEEGKIKKLGFSFHDNAQMLDKILTEHPEMEFVQLQINYLDWECDNVQSRKCYEVALKHNKEIIVMEPVKGGSLANIPERAEVLLKSANNNLSVVSWAIRFAASLPNVSMVLSGMSNYPQLIDNVSYMEEFIPLTEAENALCFMVADIINDKNVIPCTTCRYCVNGCPMNIPISEIFRFYNTSLSSNKPLDELKAIYSEICAASGGKASYCIECKQCEGHCPQHIKITECLQTVAVKFE